MNFHFKDMRMDYVLFVIDGYWLIGRIGRMEKIVTNH